MIELLRYARLKPEGVVSAALTPEGMVSVKFKRFDPTTGKEVEPEESLLTFEDLETRLKELPIEIAVIEELLKLKPR